MKALCSASQQRLGYRAVGYHTSASNMLLVLGTGRCGTSDVARILHEELSVYMGSMFHLGDQFNRKGYYEDREFQSLHLSFYMMHLYEISETDQPELWKLWRERFQELLDKREEPWGLKDPGIADFPSLLNEYLKLDPKIILCTRDKEETIQSLMRFKGKSREEMERIYNQRYENNMKAVEGRDYLEIDVYDTDKYGKIKAWL